MNYKLITLIITLAWITASAPVTAATLALEGTPFFVSTTGMRVSQLLKDFGANYRIPVIVSPLINDTFVGKLKKQPPVQQLNELSRAFNLVWYFDGKALYVYKSNEVMSSVITPEFDTQEQLKTYVRQARILSDENCQLRQVGISQSFEIYGVPECIKRITDIAGQLSIAVRNTASADQHRENVRIFPLKYASATDVNYQYRDQQVVIPGVVSVLKEMSNASSPNQQTTPTQQVAAEQNQQDSGPIFSADPRQNAVIVRDRDVNMPMYERLISELDHRQDAIEITVSIIDVNAADLGQLGVDWAVNASVGNTGLQFNTNTARGGTGRAGGTSLIANTSDFMVRVSALEQKSQAKVLSQPSVVTLNNVQAILDKNTTFYTKLVGDKVAQLASVTSGTLMQVTPRVIPDEQSGKNDVFMQLSIQDGSQQESTILASDGMPQINNSEISTQATLKSGQSLLLGGFVQDQDTTVERKIPFLGDIFWLGNFFKTKETTKIQTVRLFLIKAVPLKI
ncbi:EscC/YscC/HrcC family type III secretion system outer membrane ring protein [Enterobacter asburiae]|uniref:EscC/YscC/HrcC family type III secretion system outer membrane ring protein n=1 Tax=Enterobacter asburiae TaxID=61645 RepID=UPI00200314BA|nr:EscC/YscC/HrcC family type III secretion system outer membrane ring protein [Enterobacter asburiae]MCK7227238.1 EscC/YscC/HrcC family type III secretion system outer membrane ring protein [Enterobacter asburiae]